MADCSYLDVSTVDGDTSKLISGRIKATGALLLEVGYSNPIILVISISASKLQSNYLF